ncbi:MAG: DUF4869 domain-containing protein [Eubacterium sp.]|nr:DUF4869 domain-containing protein [Eubacterium sp.]MCI8918869.1 DUF4869 domain-containing protein [Eubacterium sp.]
MLKIIFGDIENSIYHPPTYFDNQYEDEWIIDPLSIEMIQDIDKSTVISPHLIESPVLGPISTKELSGGVKTLMLMAFDQSGKIFNASLCGDNCAKWIVKIGAIKDLTINLHHVLNFISADRFDALMLNTGRMIHSHHEYLDEALRIKER